MYYVIIPQNMYRQDLDTPENHKNGLRNNIIRKLSNFIGRNKNRGSCSNVMSKWNNDMKSVIKFKRDNQNIII